MTAPATLTTLYFGKREYDAETARRAAGWFRLRGYAVTERHIEGGDYIVQTNAPRKIALDVKRASRASRVTV